MERNKFLGIFTATYFIVAGLILALSVSLGGPSLWYFICACVLIPAGIVWTWRPDIAAGLSVGPVLGLMLLLKGCSGTYCIYLALILAGAATFIFIEYRRQAARKFYLFVISLVIVLAAIATDKLFTNVNRIVIFQMEWTDDGHAPWGDVGPITEDGQPLVVLYRRVGDGYCYDALYSSELAKQLRAAGQHEVKVEYNTFHDFSRMRSYNVRAVDGFALNDGQRAVRNAHGFGGQMLGSKEERRCW